MNVEFLNKEISWLSFNNRVLEEAQDPSVPLAMRLKFLGIYSNNLDEFFRVRVATLKRLAKLGKKSIESIGDDPKMILDQIQDIVIRQHAKFDYIFDELRKKMEEANIFFLRETDLVREEHKAIVKEYFIREVRPQIFPVMVNSRYRFPELSDTDLYLLVKLSKQGSSRETYSIIEIPSKSCPRFLLLPKEGERQYVILLEDIVRSGLDYIFHSLNFDTFQAYDIKITRDAELDIDDDFEVSYLNKIHKSLEQRKNANPVRLTYDTAMPAEMVRFIERKLKLNALDTILPGRRYHNSKDYMNFPDILPDEQCHVPTGIIHRDLRRTSGIIEVVRKKELLLHFPYLGFETIIDLLREASLDPKVTSIRVTLYRLARYSSVINALINAKKNRKEVVVLLELQARFDEKANIRWANKLKSEGVKVLFGVPGLKVHSKLCIITRKGHKGSEEHVCAIGTGNLNEDTARLYTDTYLLTSHPEICSEVDQLFGFFERNYRISRFNHLIVSPFQSRQAFIALIEEQIGRVKKGKQGLIRLQLNNLADRDLIQSLYRASEKGVSIQLIVRGMLSLIPGRKKMSENIEVISIVDSYLEHARFFIFGPDEKVKVWISSADWLPRNIDRRVEVTCPIYDTNLKRELIDLFSIEWKDNVKARRIVDGKEFRNQNGLPPWRSQLEKGLYLKRLHEEREADRS
ncbi:polyphosphate kinase 1 [Sediminispirochaeta smaragdinae]|jgi:polyphosphate kinase|uniref:Polyphosphate kinase n=1 Tax=Sediminispirochaeta smaragdinae (strain DSM 11293 / JCM 15392 / SEBR 4228) TaxID=573413 RepID=E1R6K1_SEDSS|nr:polyphosphate kinase 1 [Sediminispirochaeta smaragdinae]ADK81019.1 Polyphosphate kinase [Sediminispirochaeta smaragdinae DSM 11293]